MRASKEGWTPGAVKAGTPLAPHIGDRGESSRGRRKGKNVRCTDCGRENRADSRFCAGCGLAFVLGCSSCGRELAPDASFCDGCGTPVAPRGTATDEPTADEAVRKTVTALFCDLVGSTAFGEKVDAESVREAMARYRTMAQATIEAHGGVVAKFIGDGVMALFGVPEIAEDDAERAVRAGVALQRAFADVERHIEERHGVDVGFRVGINTGEVVIAEGDDDVVGDSLNIAARLEAACAPGEVLVGESTWRLTRSVIAFVERGEIAAKGKDEPVAAYEVIEVDDNEEVVTPFVGRIEELAGLRTVLEDSILDRSARMVTVIGPARCWPRCWPRRATRHRLWMWPTRRCGWPRSATSWSITPTRWRARPGCGPRPATSKALVTRRHRPTRCMSKRAPPSLSRLMPGARSVRHRAQPVASRTSPRRQPTRSVSSLPGVNR